MKKIIFVLFLLLLATVFCSLVSADEKLVISTYYPSPYGVYRELTVVDAIHASTSETLPNKATDVTGYLFFNPQGGSAPDPGYVKFGNKVVVPFEPLPPSHRMYYTPKIIFDPFGLPDKASIGHYVPSGGVNDAWGWTFNNNLSLRPGSSPPWPSAGIVQNCAFIFSTIDPGSGGLVDPDRADPIVAIGYYNGAGANDVYMLLGHPGQIDGDNMCRESVTGHILLWSQTKHAWITFP